MFTKFSLSLNQLVRRFTTSNSKLNQCSSIDPLLLDQALKKLYAEYVSIPIVIGNQMIFTGDEQNLRMPHNHRRVAAKYYYATKNHINLAIQKAVKVQESWSCTDVKTRSKMFHKAANTLCDIEKRAELMSAIMLSQAKTKQEAEKDVCNLILMLRTNADALIQLSELKLATTSEKIKSRYLLRPLDGFVAATGPLYMSWIAANLALTPLLMGNSVLWRPPPNCVFTSFIIFKAIMGAGVPRGALQFLPSNYKLFFNTVIKSNDLAGINYAGRVNTLRTLWHDLSIRLPHYKCFPRLVGECDSKGFHFVHESADVDLVVDRTVQATFHYSGQRTYSCARFYVPTTLWPKLNCQLQSKVQALKIGDPTDENSYASAIVREDIYDDVVSYLEYAKCSENVEILMGGNYTKTHGFFIEPTIVVCQDPNDRLMIEDIMGPILSVYIYEPNKLDEVLETVISSQKFGSCGAIFSADSQISEKLLNKLRMTASNLYVNEQCSGQDLSHLPLSGNRLSGTNDKNGSAYYLLRFAAPQLIEEPVKESVVKNEIENLNCLCS
ncbi:delta-1-pyrroline-5-carboxylate dehydrogenase, mitochondrial-like [Lucilia sericata]|uniref:delta-1-pyrroline-5-carboxylate dehydrogenase, mitochondrial-like n=1 Tax=Lucilia sericata TaxID=13632 RepID=UPI0018A83D0E|nr:delta-1-pyrroline-5-carboxylate dehydrogenase, mitochondrial-like [Lucilia sericata]